MNGYDAVHAAAIARDLRVSREVADRAVGSLSRIGLARWVALVGRGDRSVESIEAAFATVTEATS